MTTSCGWLSGPTQLLASHSKHLCTPTRLPYPSRASPCCLNLSQKQKRLHCCPVLMPTRGNELPPGVYSTMGSAFHTWCAQVSCNGIFQSTCHLRSQQQRGVGAEQAPPLPADIARIAQRASTQNLLCGHLVLTNKHPMHTHCSTCVVHP